MKINYRNKGMYKYLNKFKSDGVSCPQCGDEMYIQYFNTDNGSNVSNAYFCDKCSKEFLAEYIFKDLGEIENDS